MSEISFGFEMSDALISQAVREDCVAFARESFAPRDALIVLASTAVFALAVARESHWIWWLAGLPPAFFAVLGIGWLLAYFWLPRMARSKLAHLPNRYVLVAVSEAALSFQTATERLEVTWAELKAVKRRPNFWFFCLRAGTRLPIPADLLTREAVSLLETKHGIFRPEARPRP